MGLQTEKSVFYYIPRTGSVWVSEMLYAMNSNVQDYVKSPEEVRRDSEEKYQFGLFNRHTAPKDKGPLFSFCFVRHPSGWYKALWRAVMGRRRPIDKRFALADCWSESLDEFVDASVDKYPHGFLTQLYQYFTKDDLSGMDYVGRQENLRDDLIQALTLAGEEYDETLIKKSPKINVENYEQGELSDRVEKKLLDSEKWVINTFYAANV